jgi:hypothetical protein
VKRSPFKPGKPLQRKAPLRAKALPKADVKPARQRKCKVCGDKFTPQRGIQTWCSPDCGVVLAARLVGEKQAREHRAKLADSKPLSHWLELTQRVVNAYVLARDAERPCISCGCWDAFAFDAGHFLSRGARPELRFDLANIHKQCAACNRHKGGNQVQYRLGLVARIGLPAVEALEGQHPPAKFTREGLAELRRQIAAMTRQLAKGEACAA